MEIKIVAAILAMGVVAGTYAKSIDYCKTIVFDTGVFNYSAIMQASSDSECRDKPVPIQYKGINDTIILTSEATHD